MPQIDQVYYPNTLPYYNKSFILNEMRLGERFQILAEERVLIINLFIFLPNNNSPENVDEDSWKHLCELRRKKIESEEKIQALDEDIYSTDQAVMEREAAAQFIATELEQAVSGLEVWRKDRNYKLNNTEVLFAITQGQLEVDPQKMSPYIPGASLITESMITKLNLEIQVCSNYFFNYTL